MIENISKKILLIDFYIDIKKEKIIYKIKLNKERNKRKQRNKTTIYTFSVQKSDGGK